MIDADIILPVTTANEHTFRYAMTTIASCRETTAGRVFVMDNNSHGSPWANTLKVVCEGMGVRYEHFPQKFSTSKFFNMGLDRTNGKYIAYGSSDLMFQTQRWLENIIELWEEQPDWFCLCPFQLGSAGLACSRESSDPEKRIIRTHNVACGIAVFKRSDGYRWDEQFPYQCDSDLVYHAEANGLKMGYCCNARVEHLIGRIRMHINQTLHNEEPVKGENQLLREKWGARYMGAD